jgi:hypothetical protein
MIREADMRLVVAVCAIAMVLGCADTDPVSPVADLPPPGFDTVEPFPIDRGDDGSLTPGSYKGLWLRLIDNGAPSVTPVDGLIGLVCIGMSNSNQECSDFIQRVAGEYSAEVNPAVRVVNCAVGGHAIERWNDPVEDADLWDACVANRLPAAGVRPDQVRVLYHKAANQFTLGAAGSPLPAFPSPESDYENFRRNLGTFASRVRTKFPSVQAVYSSSRSTGTFASSGSRGEPLSYEEGHALNVWLAANPVVDGVWYGWGPYLWAPDCATGTTNGGGVCYERADFVADGIHPAAGARAKISRLLHERLLTESWYRRR